MQNAVFLPAPKRLIRLIQLNLVISLLFLMACAPQQGVKQWDPVAASETDLQAGLDRSTDKMNPAMASLIGLADQQIELRINAKQAEAWTRMAVVYLGQNNPEQCLHMAKKSNRHARGNRGLQAYNWLLMSRAYQQLGNEAQALKAQNRSAELQGRN